MRPRQYALSRSASSASASFSCSTATRDFDAPIGFSPTTIRLGPFAQSARNVFGAVAVRTRTSTPGSHRRRVAASANAWNSVCTGTPTVRLAPASNPPPRR
ncbi:hypothetical protein GA0070215_104269 [Micromonospora marina]|uniref:Uncharacterized protein n=1 Tax=Micromonospora marina TaxID=307120 RepID=A0A1C4W722_9ACTN|nr:hypothetical protein GA0070215_104269 [Micromonospora marina]